MLVVERSIHGVYSIKVPEVCLRRRRQEIVHSTLNPRVISVHLSGCYWGLVRSQDYGRDGPGTRTVSAGGTDVSPEETLDSEKTSR